MLSLTILRNIPPHTALWYDFLSLSLSAHIKIASFKEGYATYNYSIWSKIPKKLTLLAFFAPPLAWIWVGFNSSTFFFWVSLFLFSLFLWNVIIFTIATLLLFCQSEKSDVFLFLQDWLLLKRWWKVWLFVSSDSFFDDSVFMGIGFCNWSWIHQILLFLQILNLFQVKFCLKLMFYCFNIA